MPDKSEKYPILIITGTLENSLHPVPPIADGAPEWNVFRLAEAQAQKDDCKLDIHIVSPCEKKQLEELYKYPVARTDRYQHVPFSNLKLAIYRKLIRHILPLRLLVRRLAKLPDLMSWWYLKRVKSILNEWSPQLVFINARPQYIRYLRKIVESGRLFFFMRGPLGESRRSLHLTDGIIVNSYGMYKYVHQFIEPGKPPVWVMPNSLGEDFVNVEENPERFLTDQKIIIFAGRIIPEKGVLELLQAFRLVLEKLPKTRLVICGASANFKMDENLSDYEMKVQKEAENFPAEKVILKGYVPNKQMAAYYSSAAVAVFPSLMDIYTESFGMVALEAMRCETPVVASRQPGFQELIVPGETGLLVDDPKDAKLLASAILQILHNPQLAQRMGRAGYEKSLDYTPDKALQAFEKIIEYIEKNEIQ